MIPVTRRRFLLTGSALLAGLGVSPASAWAIPVNARTRRQRLAEWFPAPRDEQFRALALMAMDAAKSGGAEYADIRIGLQRSVGVPLFPYSPSASFVLGYGVRARVHGTWSFASGTILTRDAVATVARTAAVGATQYAAINATLGPRVDAVLPSELAPAPVVTGSWHAPMEIDPFAIPLDDYYRTISMIGGSSERVTDSANVACVGLGWQSELRVYASTDGSLVTQTFLRGGPSINALASLPSGGHLVISNNVANDEDGGVLGGVLGGYETALRADLPERMIAAREEAARWAELPYGTFNDVGRYPIVFSGPVWASSVGATLSRALDGDMAAGLERDTSGSTFLRPPMDFLGAPQPLFSPLLTLESRRDVPSTTAAGWDDEGVVPEPYTLIDRGHVTDYHTTRDTAPILTAWYQRQGKPLRSHGSAVSTTPTAAPVGGFGHVHVVPAAQRAHIDDLLSGMRRGFYIIQGQAVDGPGFTAGKVGGPLIVEIRNGKPMSGAVIEAQLVTKLAMGSKLVALGDASTVGTGLTAASKGVPWQDVIAPVTAPAALCADVAVKGYA